MLPCSSPQLPPGAHARTHTHTHTLLITYLIYEVCLLTHGARGGLSRALPQAPSLSGTSQTAVLAQSIRARFCLSSWPGWPVKTPASTHGDVRPVIQQSSQSTPGFAAGKPASGKAPRLGGPQFPRLEDVTSPLPQGSVVVRVRGSESQGRRRGALRPVGPRSTAPLPRSIPVSGK